MNYKKLILDKLLNKYEKSKSFKTDSNRRICLKLSDLKEYDIENYEEKKLFHDTVEQLKREGLIEFSWEKFENGNILKEIWLNKQNIEKAYHEINRNNKKQEADEILKRLMACQFQEQWLENFRIDMIQDCQNNLRPPRLLPYFYDEKILIALSNLIQEQEILKRVFSIKCFGDSKYFENEIENYLVSIIKKYLLQDWEEEITNDEILEQVGIVKAPEVIEFCGNLIGKVDGKEIEYSTTTKGSYINSYAIRKIENLEIQKAKKILFIENKTNYIDYILNHQKEDEFVVYHGGMYSPTKKVFFQKLYQCANSNMTFYHWSDIDVGGFKIFIRLQEQIIPTLQPYAMSKTELEDKKDYWKSITQAYKKELEKLYQNARYEIFKDTIKFMIENECKLEQECFIL